MKIFNVELFGEDKLFFLSLNYNKKKSWIEKNTNQKDDNLIDEFIKNIANVQSISTGNDKEAGNSETRKLANPTSEGNSITGQRGVKKGEN